MGGSSMLAICGMIIMFVQFIALSSVFIYLSHRVPYVPRDPVKRQFGHKPRMTYLTKLSCGQVIARMWTDSYGPFDYKFGKEEDGSYTFTINRMICFRSVPGRAAYKVLVTPEQEGSAVYLYLFDYRASNYALNVFAWELKGFLEKKLDSVRVE